MPKNASHKSARAEMTPKQKDVAVQVAKNIAIYSAVKIGLLVALNLGARRLVKRLDEQDNPE